MNERSFSGNGRFFRLNIMQHKSEMTELIFSATEQLMAKEGLHQLSMHKIAKQAGISAGTIYIYFENKEDLLTQLVQYVFTRFRAILLKDFDENEEFYTQYCRFWWNLWFDLQLRPEIVLNFHQYKILPGFTELVDQCMSDPKHPWNIFCANGNQKGVLCGLPSDILFSISLDSAINLSAKSFYTGITYPKSVLDKVVQQTWQAIKK